MIEAITGVLILFSAGIFLARQRRIGPQASVCTGQFLPRQVFRAIQRNHFVASTTPA